jgi:hypothetical protein
MHADNTKTIPLLKFVALILYFHVAHPAAGAGARNGIRKKVNSLRFASPVRIEYKLESSRSN